MRSNFYPRPQALLLALSLLLSSFSTAFAVDGDVANGKTLFKSNCASCHKLDKKLVGPALGGVTERRDLEWLVKWIRNNQELRESGDKDAIAIFEEYNGSVMSAFPALSDQDIYDILAYSEAGDQPAAAATPADGAAAAPAEEEKDYSLVTLISLSLFFILLITLLAKVKNTLKAVKGQDTSTILEDTGFWTRAVVRNQKFIILLTLVVAVFLIKETYYALMAVGVEQGYQPEQPIAFSHKLHAGDNQIDCNYCHSSARNSKTSGIPSANVCMNCHMYIDGSEIKDASGQPKYGGERSPEIAKIYAAIGWDADKREYTPNYEQKPIKWVRIHNLPDLAYFNHAQHVTAGQVECQTCHGPVQEMEEVYQYSELTMGWCINCHRETEVQVETNGYYATMHDALKEKYKGEKITVSKIGGLECGKCHY